MPFATSTCQNRRLESSKQRQLLIFAVCLLPGLFLALVIRQRKHTAEATLARIESLILSKHKFS